MQHQVRIPLRPERPKETKKYVDSLENQRSVEEKLVLEEDVGDEELRKNDDLLRKKKAWTTFNDFGIMAAVVAQW